MKLLKENRHIDADLLAQIYIDLVISYIFIFTEQIQIDGLHW